MLLSRISALSSGQAFSDSIVGLDEERHEAQLGVVALLEGLAVLLPDLDHGRHVDFVEGGQERAVFWASTSRSAMRRRSHVMGTISSRRAATRGGGRGTGAKRTALATMRHRRPRRSFTSTHLGFGGSHRLLEDPAAGSPRLDILGRDPASAIDRRLRRRHDAGDADAS